MLGKDEFGPPELWTEHQRQAIHFFSNAIERMRQEKMSEYDIVFWFQNFMGAYLEKLYGLKLYIGSTPQDATPTAEIEPIRVKSVKDKAGENKT
jgi:hypothetical protein